MLRVVLYAVLGVPGMPVSAPHVAHLQPALPLRECLERQRLGMWVLHHRGAHVRRSQCCSSLRPACQPAGAGRVDDNGALAWRKIDALSTEQASRYNVGLRTLAAAEAGSAQAGRDAAAAGLASPGGPSGGAHLQKPVWQPSEHMQRRHACSHHNKLAALLGKRKPLVLKENAN